MSSGQVRVAIVGAGDIGRGWAALCVAAGWPVSIFDMDGRALAEIIEQNHLATHPLSFIPSYEPAVGKERGLVGSTMDDSIREQLKSLGYIE